jgi:hypothetical protein
MDGYGTLKVHQARMHSFSLAGPNTAKRKIQLRQYVTEKSKRTQSHSDPFLPDDENDSSPNLNPRMAKLSFTTAYVPEPDLCPTDEILSSRINLDEADRFIATLKMPSRRRPTRQTRDEPYKPQFFAHLDLSAFGAVSERVERQRFAGAEDPDEDDDYDII